MAARVIQRSLSHLRPVGLFLAKKKLQGSCCNLNSSLETCLSAFVCRSCCIISYSKVNGLQKLNEDASTPGLAGSTCPSKVQETVNFKGTPIRDLRYLCENRDLTRARELLDSLIDCNVNVTSAVNCLLYHALEYNDTECIEYVLSKIAKHDIQRDNATFFLLTRCYAARGMVHHGIRILRQMQSAGIQIYARNYQPLVLSAARTGDLELAFSLCNEMGKVEKKPSHCYAALIEGVTNSDDSIVWRGKVFELLQQFRRERGQMDAETLNAIKNWFNSQRDVQWNADWSTVNDSGECQSCGQSLETGLLSADEHATLKTHFTQHLWHIISQLPSQQMKCFTPVGNFTDIPAQQVNGDFPETLDKYIAMTGPYDVVVDALNVGYQRKGFLSRMVKDTVSLLLHEGKKVLVIGASPITFNSKKPDIGNLVTFLSHHCGMFLVRDSASKKNLKSGIPDDMYMLIAAMHCGMDTLLVSNDMFHDHMHSLPVSIRSIFSRWLRCHQVIFTVQEANTIYKRHPAYDDVVQTTGDSWHLPSAANDRWLCVQRR